MSDNMFASCLKPDAKLWSVTAEFTDGRKIEHTFPADSLGQAVRVMRMQYPEAKDVSGEFVMTYREYAKG